MNTTTAPAQDWAYTVWVRHTYTCTACRTAPCVTAIKLGRAWRDAR